MTRYTKAFKRHAEARFSAIKKKVEAVEVNKNAEVLFPHDFV
jgi:hypothetical protein